MAADSAVRGIRQVDGQGSIGLIGKEPDPPYNRPPLSKGLWQRLPLKRIWRNTAALGVDLRLGRAVRRLDLHAKLAIDDRGQEHRFDRLLLATGAEPIRLGAPGERILYYRTLQDYLRLRALTEDGSHFLVIGGGFIGSEIAAALSGRGKQVTMVFPEAGIGGRTFSTEQALFLNEFYRQKGVRVLEGRLIRSLSETASGAAAVTGDGETLQVDAVVAGLGVSPNLELARQAGLQVRSGIVVDEFMRTAHPDVFSAGDVTEFYNPTLERFVQVQHEESANLAGLAAGRAMAGEPQAYTALPYFYSDLFELNYQAIGEANPSMQVVDDWIEPHRRGAQYYLSAGRVRGVALWGLPFAAIEQARRLIAEPAALKPADLKGRIQS